MSALKFPLYSLAALSVVLIGTSPAAQAQVRINMTTAQQTNCVATTDSDGVRLVAGTTDLAASGVTLTGTGCQSGSGSSGNFAANVSVQGTATAPTSVNVQWSASTDATRCMYGGTSAPGWPAGTLACQDATSCSSPSPHVIPVTIGSAGTYNFSVSCTNSTGYAAGTLTAGGSGGGLPVPANFALTAPAQAATATPFQVSWSVTGATSCTGSASLNGSSANLLGWTDQTSATSPRSVTASAAGSYVLSLTCSNTAGSVTSQNATVVVGPVDLTCPSAPLTRQTVGNIQYPPYIGTGQPTRQNVDLTQWNNIWGHNTATDAMASWPGLAGSSPVITAFGRTQYIAAKFHTTSTLSPTLSGFYKNVSNFGGTTIDMTISPTCGDFQPVRAGCIRSNVAPADTGAVYWRSASDTGFYCHLDPDTDYYLNIRMSDPAAGNANCAAGNPTCKLHVSNNYGG
jgi:hypothetical protein